ncbi:hypothetical protein C6Y45_13790 [Alkalicoccus saliphilus]|uniref:Uncharacterized protein n=1 Tax=Alkalicoccus saliphilus TaxID=200989 RepID=A0A2T4U3E8_9BACI|nr:hypothetical protein C6Y45_13790 [Alkalicoccus saliphilus]
MDCALRDKGNREKRIPFYWLTYRKRGKGSGPVPALCSWTKKSGADLSALSKVMCFYHKYREKPSRKK